VYEIQYEVTIAGCFVKKGNQFIWILAKENSILLSRPCKGGFFIFVYFNLFFSKPSIRIGGYLLP